MYPLVNKHDYGKSLSLRGKSTNFLWATFIHFLRKLLLFPEGKGCEVVTKYFTSHADGSFSVGCTFDHI